jgi:hypothetical protein
MLLTDAGTQLVIDSHLALLRAEGSALRNASLASTVLLIALLFVGCSSDGPPFRDPASRDLRSAVGLTRGELISGSAIITGASRDGEDLVVSLVTYVPPEPRMAPCGARYEAIGVLSGDTAIVAVLIVQSTSSIIANADAGQANDCGEMGQVLTLSVSFPDKSEDLSEVVEVIDAVNSQRHSVGE